jgi:hypothetical protein
MFATVLLDGFQGRDIQTQVELWLFLFGSCPDETAQNKEALTFLVDFLVVVEMKVLTGTVDGKVEVQVSDIGIKSEYCHSVRWMPILSAAPTGMEKGAQAQLTARPGGF